MLLTTVLSIHVNAQQWTFATRFGGTAASFSDAAKAVCADASGNIYVTGNFNSTINFGNGTGTLTATTPGTATDGFVAKFSAAGLCQWSIRFGGAATDQGGLGIITDGAKVYVTGQSQFPATIGSTALTTVGGSTDGVVFALDASTGNTLWAKAFGGGSTNDQGQAITMDGAGNLYISGVFSTRTTNPAAWFGTALSFPRTVQGSMAQPTSDMFVAKLLASDGSFQWVSAGGAFSQAAPLIVGNDNVSGSSIAFIPGANQLIVAGSFANSNASYFSNGSSTASFTLTNQGQADISIIKLDLAGNFISGFASGGANPDEALGITYDASTGGTYFTGYFNSASIAGAISLTNTSSGFDEIYYARYNPSDNSFPWAKRAEGTASGNDFGTAITTDGNGNLYATGRFQSTVQFQTAASTVNAVSSGADDVYLIKIDPATGNALELGTSSGSSGTDMGYSLTTAPGNNVWVGGIVAAGTMNFLPSSPNVSVTVAVDQELFIARYNDPPPSIGTQPQPSATCLGLASSFTVVASGPSLTYQWQESTDIGFSAPVTLTNAGVYSTTTTSTLNISNNTTVNGRYYRAIVTNSGGSTTSNGALLNATIPALPAMHITATQTVNTLNNLYYGASCALIAKIVPSGGSPVAGSVTSDVWVESSVPAHLSQPFVQRHYQVTPAVNPLTATATVTLYFSQGEFDAFNTAYGSVVFPVGPSDNTRKANIRIGKYSGSTNNGTGLPVSYTSTASVIDPADASIVWNGTTSMWEISFPVTGFSGFILQVNQFTLPVDLTSFSAQLLTTDIKLNWKTADELNNDHFELERSTDGRTFSPVAQVRAIAGQGIKNYDWVDANAVLLNTSRIYYRLKIVSVAGASEYSNTIVVALDKSGKLVTGIRPNPFTDKVIVDLNLPASGKLSIQLTDINGTVLSQSTIQAPKGFSTQEIKAIQQLSARIYYLSVSFEGQQYSFKVMKQN
jgi:hypothetical protein